MTFKSMLLIAALGTSSLGFSLTEDLTEADCGKIIYCTMDMNPHICEDTETGYAFKGSNECHAFASVFRANCRADIEFNTSSIVCEKDGDLFGLGGDLSSDLDGSQDFFLP